MKKAVAKAMPSLNNEALALSDPEQVYNALAHNFIDSKNNNDYYLSYLLERYFHKLIKYFHHYADTKKCSIRRAITVTMNIWFRTVEVVNDAYGFMIVSPRLFPEFCSTRSNGYLFRNERRYNLVLKVIKTDYPISFYRANFTAKYYKF